MTQSNRGYINHIHAFRGIAILGVILVHAWALPIAFTKSSINSNSVDALKIIIETLFHGSTLLFAIISGVLFSHILSDKGFSRFFSSKCKFVVLPYIIITVALTGIFWSSRQNIATFDFELFNFIATAALNVINGTGTFQLWYMPVLFVLFLFTPIIHWLGQNRIGRMCLLLIVILPLFVSRTWPEITIGTYVYFLGAYTAGILIGKSYISSLNHFKKYLKVFVSICVLTTISIITLLTIDFTRIADINIQESAFYLQKLSFACLLLTLMSKKEAKLPKFLMMFGTYSFSLYFLHMLWYVLILKTILPLQLISDPFLMIITYGFVLLVVGTFLSLAVAKIFQSLLGKRSRYIVGV